MQRISDNGNLEPLPFDNDPELVKWARYGVDQLKAQNAARAKYEQAQREQRNGIGLNELLCHTLRRTKCKNNIRRGRGGTARQTDHLHTEST